MSENMFQLEQRESKQIILFAPPQQRISENMMEMNLQLRVHKPILLLYDQNDVVYVEMLDNGNEIIHYDEKNMIKDKMYVIQWYGDKVGIVKKDNDIILSEL